MNSRQRSRSLRATDKEEEEEGSSTPSGTRTTTTQHPTRTLGIVWRRNSASNHATHGHHASPSHPLHLPAHLSGSGVAMHIRELTSLLQNLRSRRKHMQKPRSPPPELPAGPALNSHFAKWLLINLRRLLHIPVNMRLCPISLDTEP